MKHLSFYIVFLSLALTNQASFANSNTPQKCQSLAQNGTYQHDGRLGQSKGDVDLTSCYYHQTNPITDGLKEVLNPTGSTEDNTTLNNDNNNNGSGLDNDTQEDENVTLAQENTPQNGDFKGYFFAYDTSDDYDTLTQTDNVSFSSTEGQQDVSFSFDTSERTLNTGEKDHFGAFEYTAIVEGFFTGKTSDFFFEERYFDERTNTSKTHITAAQETGFWVVGQPTQNLPQSGHVYYTGEVTGNSYIDKPLTINSDENYTEAMLLKTTQTDGYMPVNEQLINMNAVKVQPETTLSGHIQIYADLNNQQLGGTFSVETNVSTYNVRSPDERFFSIASFSTLNIDPTTKSFVGDLTFPDENNLDPDFIKAFNPRGDSGFIRGSFFGPNGEEIGGQWIITEDNSKTAAWGVFRAKDSWNGTTFFTGSAHDNAGDLLTGYSTYISEDYTEYSDGNLIKEGLLNSDNDPLLLDMPYGQAIPLEDKDYFGEYAYTSMGRWSNDDYASYSIFDGRTFLRLFDSGYFVAGQETTTMPTSGSASYAGTLHGDFRSSEGVLSRASMGGTLSLSADFAQNSVSGNMNVTKDNSAYASASFSDVNIYANNFSSSLNINSGNVQSGSIDGKFFGPNAEEAGGVWSLASPQTDPNNFSSRDQAVGVFRASQVTETPK